MKIDIKNMQIMIYYELDYQEELLSLIDAYKHFLQRDNQAAEQTRERTMMFVKFVSSLVKCRINEKNEDGRILKKEIEDTPYFNLKEWLLEKTKEFGK
jgi:hypothetical protein